MTTTMPLTGPLIQSCSTIESRGKSFVQEKFRRYGVSSYAVYVDHTTRVEDLPEMDDARCVGYFSYDINMLGRPFADKEVQGLVLGKSMPDCDGWLVASTSRASAFSLAKGLKEAGAEDQIIVRFYGGQTTEISAYMDFLAGDTETIISLQHYYDRKYRITFPLDIRWTVCACDGTVVRSGQWVIRPNACVALDSRELDLGDFKGYIFVELEVENLQVRVQPFIHFWADYLSEDGLCRNHQSGWSPWPAGTVFNRGILPKDSGFEAYASLYNANEEPATVTATLHFNRGDGDEVVARELPPVPPGQMAYHNLTALFNDVPFREAEATYVLLTCDEPLHRPNHYIVKAGTFRAIDTYHQTGGHALHLNEEMPSVPAYQMEVRRKAGLKPYEVMVPLLEQRFETDTILGLLSLTFCFLSDVYFRAYDASGKMVFERETTLSTELPVFLNVNEYLAENGVVADGGRFVVSPKEDQGGAGVGFFLGLKHKAYQGVSSTSFVAGQPDINIPVYGGRFFPKSREYQYSPLQVSDHFGPGMLNDEFDSLYVVRHRSMLQGYDKVAEYRLEIFDQDGRLHTLYRTIAPNSHDVFSLSDVLKDAGIEGRQGNYTLWFKSYEQVLKPYIGLFRKSDKAIALDDASEGTLQRDPQIGQIDLNEFDAYLESIGHGR